MAGSYVLELESLQRWVKAVAGFNSMRLTMAPPKVARPIIIWEAPQRLRDRSISRYKYVNRVLQYGKLYVSNLDELNEVQDKLLTDLEDKTGVLPYYDSNGNRVGWLKAVEIEFTNSEGLDVPFIIRYEATYSRTKPADPPAATYVGTKVTTQLE